MQIIEICYCKYILTHALAHSNLIFFPLFFWFSYPAACAPVPPCGRSLEVTSMFCLVSSHSRHSFRWTEGSEYSLYHRPWGCVFTTFTSFAVGFCYWCVVVIFPSTKVLFCPSFFFPPSSSLHLHYPCPWQHVPILQPLSFLSLSVAAFALTPWGFTLI